MSNPQSSRPGLKGFLGFLGDLGWGILLSIGEIYGNYEATQQLLQDHGWPPVPGLDSELHKKLAPIRRKEEEDQAQELARMLTEFYTGEELDELLDTWEKTELFEARMPILREALAAHKNGRYFLTLPVLFAQFEGILVSAFNVSDRYQGHHLEEMIEKVTLEAMIMRTDATNKEFWENEVRASFRPGHPLRSDISRHAIVHGASTRYGTEGNSLKGFLHLNHLHRVLRHSFIGQGGALHRPGCSSIEFDLEQITFHRNLLGGPYTGSQDYQPCRKCKPSIDRAQDSGAEKRLNPREAY